MSGALSKIRGFLRAAGAFRPFQSTVPIVQLRHESLHAHLQEGYGGQPIQSFPPFVFFQLYTQARAAEAREQFERWYHEQFRKYANVSKGKGGMHSGSLYREVVDEHTREGIHLRDKQPVFRDDLVTRAIKRRVDQRFALIDSIRERGYQAQEADPVIGIAHADSTVHLTGGHHRAAALSALGQSSLPDVIVLSPRAGRLAKRLRILK